MFKCKVRICVLRFYYLQFRTLQQLGLCRIVGTVQCPMLLNSGHCKPYLREHTLIFHSQIAIYTFSNRPTGIAITLLSTLLTL